MDSNLLWRGRVIYKQFVLPPIHLFNSFTLETPVLIKISPRFVQIYIDIYRYIDIHIYIHIDPIGVWTSKFEAK